MLDSLDKRLLQDLPRGEGQTRSDPTAQNDGPPVLLPRPPVTPGPVVRTPNLAAESESAPNPEAPKTLPEPPPAPATRVATPEREPLPGKILGMEMEVEEPPAARPATEPVTVRTNLHVMPPVVQAIAASTHAEAPVAETARPASPGARPLGAAFARGETEGVTPQPAAANSAPRSQERVDFVERIMRAAKLARSQGGTRMRIVLNPPNLGSLRVNLVVRNHVLHGTILAESLAARDLILNHLPQLKESLQQQGVQVGEFEVNVEQGKEQASQQFQSDADREAPSFPSTAPPETRSERSEPNEAEPRIRSAQLQVLDLVA